MERFGIFRISLSHWAALSCREVEQVEIGLMMPDAELSIIGECVAKETPIVGGTREGYRLLLSRGIDNSVYTVAEVSCFGVEIDAA